MRGPNTKPSEQLAQKQAGWGEEQMGYMREDRVRRDLLTQPAIDFYTSLVSGDQKAMNLALAPIKTQTADFYKQARENVMNTAPRGAGQEFALAQLPITAASTEASSLYPLVSGGFDKLANIGSGYGSFSLAELGGGLRAGEGAGQTYGNVMNAQAQKKAATMGFLGDLAGAAGSMGASALMPKKA